MIRWTDLTPEERSLFGNEAGATWNEKLVPELVYTSFGQHDFYYMRGGNIIDKVRADFYMLGYMVVDAANQDMLWKMFWYSLVAIIYFLAVFIFGVFYFEFGKQKTRAQIIEEANKLF